MTNDPKDFIKQYYSPSAKQPQIITVPPLNFLMIDGHGDPNNEPSYPVAISALYTLSYTLKVRPEKSRYTGIQGLPASGIMVG